jgi:gamma-glutamyltranspeptidase/glutathione hydrolase
MNENKRHQYDSESDDLSLPLTIKAQKLAVSRQGMISTQHYLATEAGAKILANGGNAIDAAVAAALASGVCEPAASGLGGQTMMLLHIAKTRKTVALDGSSRAPHRAIPHSLSESDRLRGYKSTTVPSTPRTLAYALRRYGSLSWSEVMQPAIKLADEGYAVSELQYRLTRKARKYLKIYAAGRFFLKNGSRLFRPGEIFRQPVLAETLDRLARYGDKSFYRGRIARLISQDMIRNRGLIRRDDLAQMRGPIERRPVSCKFDDMRIITFPPPGAGRTLVEMLNIASHFPRKYRNPGKPEGALLLARIMRQAYRDRGDRPYDPDSYAQVSNKKMISPDYAKKVARRLRSGGETTHISVMDKFGNAVGLTQSIERIYGSCVVTPELGFLYNNYMMAFEYDDISHPYFMRPGAVPWASVAPTIAFKGRHPWLVIGSPGSERIITSIFQVLLRLRRQTPYEAVDAPRLYCSSNSRVSLEAPRMRDDIPLLLEQNGFTIDRRDSHSFYMGCVQLVIRDGNLFVGVADPRRDGSASGPRI